MEQIIDAIASARLEDARAMIIEYQQALGVSLCFQNFDNEIDDLAGFYASPGRLYLGVDAQDAAVACVGLRPIELSVNSNKEDDIHEHRDRQRSQVRSEHAEIKRLYVQPRARANGLGRRLVQAVLDDARDKGFKSIYLDTLPQLEAAIHLYQQFGFRDTEPYCDNPLPGVRWMSMQL